MASRFRKKWIGIGVAVAIMLAAAIVALVSQANRIIKHELERALGENFAVESLALGWNRVEINGPRLLRNGRVVAQARRIILTPEMFDLLKPGFSISSIVLEEPALTLEIDRGGRWVVPAPIGKEQDPPPPSKPSPLTVGRIKVSDGAVFFQDHRRPEPNRVELRKIHLSLDHLAFPLQDSPATFDFQTQLAGSLVSGSASGRGTIRFDKLAFNGRFKGQNLILLDAGAAGPAARVQDMSFEAASEGAAARSVTLTDLVLIKPFLRLQSDRTGKTSVLPPGGTQREKAGKRENAPVSVVMKNLNVEDGELFFLDGKIDRKPYPVRFTGIELTADQLSFPTDERRTAFKLSARLPGTHSTGVLVSNGHVALKTLDASAKGSLRELDLTSVKPYLLKEGDVDISRGSLDLDVDLGIRQRTLYAPARSVMRDLQFVRGSGLADRFLGVPRELVVNALKTGNNRIEIDFVLEGSLDNPRFSLRESMITRLTVGLAKNLGLSVIETGGTVIIQSGRIMKGVGDIIKEIFK